LQRVDPVSRGVILAADKGMRFDGKTHLGHKSLAELGGLSLIERIISPSKQIERGALKFIKGVKIFLSKHLKL
jgi:choline kinase